MRYGQLSEVRLLEACSGCVACLGTASQRLAALRESFFRQDQTRVVLMLFEQGKLTSFCVKHKGEYDDGIG